MWTPSDGGERAVSNQIFLVADSQPSGKLSHFYVSADHEYVLAGSKVNISAAAVDTNFIPMDKTYSLKSSAGTMDGNVLTTPSRGGEITVTAESGGKRGTATVHAIDETDAVAIRNSGNTIITTLTAVPGTETTLKATAAYKHLPLQADAEAFTWTVNGDIGTISETGVFAATTPGTGSITVSAGGQSATVQVTVSRMALKTVEDFESSTTIFTPGQGYNAQFSRATSAELVRMGRGSGKLSYTLTEDPDYGMTARVEASTALSSIYTGLNLWVYGDGSGNTLNLLYGTDTASYLTQPITTLDFTGWKQVSVELPGARTIQGLEISAGSAYTYDDGLGNLIIEYPDTARTGTVYIDHIVATFAGTVDSTVPDVTLQVSGTALTGTVTDAVDGVPAKSAVSVTYDGKALSFSYNETTGAISATLPDADGNAHRVTVTAKDASGNIGRKSYDIAVGGEWLPTFSDTKDYWAATYVDYLYTSGITTGYADGTFRPNQNITRAQFAVMLYRYLGLDESKYAGVTLPFADNSRIADYAIPAIKALYTEGIINGSAGTDGKLYFNPNASLTRAQAATMIGRTQAKGYAAEELTFTDAGKIPAYATYYIQTMVAQGVISGYTDGSFKPNSNITRGQMAKILYNLM